jgi:hypothetical protein
MLTGISRIKKIVVHAHTNGSALRVRSGWPLLVVLPLIHPLPLRLSNPSGAYEHASE